MDVARQPVQFGDDECCLRSLCVCEGFGKLGPVGPLARLDLLVGGDDLVLALSSVVGNAGVLGFQAETAFTLPSCRNPVVRYQLAHLCSCPSLPEPLMSNAHHCKCSMA